ncbi:DNA-directed RNA polymerase sigma-70 factor [Steroidobacter agaridevorans]|uniref:DNA-directed RNA polymerase sigma-70 factor n=1 Tax=Steroidobacter agaridevorans TaxID=2695856 RepID=A0A829YA43_9GAMM|nr:sigma-70 family RNA polymerase sigma factor [Steroidobacter agaridevorans]GFE80214.1 DNA-directed RNA polymerase sigma-70 factor [Steroidobacter agaridevorans]GFE89816.1 DNA-directed RNA polymerase sigma-70 factor [Steroidobacter agaridevorans]
MKPINDLNAQPLTQLLVEWRNGDQRALSQLTAVLYEDLRRMAERYLRRERPDHTIQRTALVHEAFVRLLGQQATHWRDRSHFFALASKLMRGILVDHARARFADKRGGGRPALSLDALVQQRPEEEGVSWHMTTPTALQHLDTHTEEDVSAIDEALSRLERIDPRQAQIVEMRYFGGLTIEQTAQVMGISDATVKREWMHARAWLRCELGKIL